MLRRRRAHVRCGRYDASSFAPLLPGHRPGAADAPGRPFGTGFLLIDEQVIPVCEGICRRYRTRLETHFHRQFVVPDKSLPTATHVANCLAWQRRNVEAYQDRSVFFTYEEMCGVPGQWSGKSAPSFRRSAT